MSEVRNYCQHVSKQYKENKRIESNNFLSFIRTHAFMQSGMKEVLIEGSERRTSRLCHRVRGLRGSDFGCLLPIVNAVNPIIVTKSRPNLMVPFPIWESSYEQRLISQARILSEVAEFLRL